MKMHWLIYFICAIYTLRALMEFSYGKYAHHGAAFDYALVAVLCAVILWVHV
jgi:hypothetical protein